MKQTFPYLETTFALCLSALCSGASAQFIPGHVFGGTQLPANVYNITAGGDFSLAVPFVNAGSNQAGQFAWSANLSTMYIPVYGENKVIAVTAAGIATDFASGLSGPTGLIRTSAGRLLVSEYGSGQITDITAGGDFTASAPFASGLSGPRNFLERGAQLLVAEQNAGEISDVSLGGVIGLSVYASGFNSPIDLVPGPGGFYVADYAAGTVTLVTAPGNYSAAAPFATGRSFIGLTYTTAGRLLAAALSEGAVYDITAGGDFSAAPHFALFGGAAESNLDTVPIPEPAGALLFAIATLVTCGMAHRVPRKRTIVGIP